MVAKLKSILRNQRFRLACSSLIFFVVLAQFMRSGSLWWGGAYLLTASFLYFRPIFNASSNFPLFIGIVSTPFFFPSGLGITAAILFSALCAILFFAALGSKNLVLTHRAAWREAGAYALSYVVLLLFFMQAINGPFLLLWVWAVSVLWLMLCLTMPRPRLAFVCIVLIGELIWIVSWLPIGFLSMANLCFAVLLFIGDSAVKNRVTIRTTALFSAFIALVFLSSYWLI